MSLFTCHLDKTSLPKYSNITINTINRILFCFIYLLVWHMWVLWYMTEIKHNVQHHLTAVQPNLGSHKPIFNCRKKNSKMVLLGILVNIEKRPDSSFDVNLFLLRHTAAKKNNVTKRPLVLPPKPGGVQLRILQKFTAMSWNREELLEMLHARLLFGTYSFKSEFYFILI